MSTFKFVPALAKGEKAEFDGHIILLVPTIPQRMRLMSKVGIKVSTEGQVVKIDDSLTLMADFIEELGVYVKEISLTYVDEGVNFKKWDDLITYPECQPILMEMVTLFMAGFKPDPH